MPYPFTKGVFICGEPIYVDANAGPEDMEKARATLERALTELTERADRYFGGRLKP